MMDVIFIASFIFNTLLVFFFGRYIQKSRQEEMERVNKIVDLHDKLQLTKTELEFYKDDLKKSASPAFVTRI